MTPFDDIFGVQGVAASGVMFVLYDPGGGRIAQVGSCSPFDLRHQGGGGLERLDGVSANPLTDYVVGGWVIPRPVFAGFDKSRIRSDGADTARMSVPPGCPVKIDGVDHVVDDGEIVLAAAAGVWRIEIDHWPYMPFATEVAACESI